MRYLAFMVALAGLSCAEQTPEQIATNVRDESATHIESVPQNPNSPTGGPSNSITLTLAAAEQVKKHLADFTPRHHLRVSVRGGGCSGFTNHLDIENTFDPDRDIEFVAHGVRVVTDKRSALYLGGVTIDWVTKGGKTGFSITNPNAKPIAPEANGQTASGAAPDPASR